MKKYFLIIFLLLNYNIVWNQTRFTTGFEAGYRVGWCYDKGISCIPPIPPIAPIPKIGEDMNSYEDGYNRGFTMGKEDSKTEKQSSKTRERYQTSEPEFVNHISDSQKANYRAIQNQNYRVLAELQQHRNQELIKAVEFCNIAIDYKDFEEAYKWIQSIANIYPNHFVIYVLQSNVYYAQGDWANAYNYAYRGASIAKRNDTEEFLIARENTILEYFSKLIKEGKFQKVIDYHNRINYPSVLMEYYRGIAYYNLNDYTTAKKILKKVPLKYSREALKAIENINLQTKIENYLEKKEYKKALKILSKIETYIDKKSINNTEYIQMVYTNMAICYLQLEDLFKAYIYATKAINIFPNINSPICYIIKAQISHSWKNWEEVISNTSQAIEKLELKDQGDMYFLRAIAQSEIGNYNASNTDYNFLINNYERINYRTNSLATLYNNKAHNFVLLKEYDKAKLLIEIALSLDDKTGYIWDTKGELNFYLENYHEAIESITKALECTDEDKSFHDNSFYYRGMSYLLLDNKEKGCIDLKKSKELGKKEAQEAINKYCK
jgi:tetratricopeptide repeat protein|nr:tetratricopeptide repeat protein [uncultured Capnocytophaga sp.]